MMTTGGVLVGEIAHIQGPLPASPRFNPDMTNEQRRQYENLLMLCGTHHTAADMGPEGGKTSAGGCATG
jgi:hypothetical protein